MNALLFNMLAILFLVLPACATAQSGAAAYPSRPVRVINPYPAGGPADIIGRLLGERLQGNLGQPFVTDNRAGAAGNIGAMAVARAAPDGYTLLLCVDFTLGTNPVLYQKPGFDPHQDFSPVTLLAKSQSVLVVNAGVAANSVKELIALARQKPLTFASGGNGTPGHLSGELFKQVAGVDMTHVPYKGNAAAVASVVSGETQMFIAAMTTMLPQVKAGRVRALVIANENRAAALPGVPNAAEAGVSGIEVDSWFALLAPARTPQEVIDKLHREVANALRDPDLRARLEQASLEPLGLPSAEVTRLIERDLKKWGPVIARAGIKVD
ncbi:MAG: tripartite tricarboxylate transporter substrate binding protein [Betaproteobacteria bacterium]|nr:tripartite tricarboxylate transporter substrate binding protein [Betaproteobacteria bacterium]